MNRLSENMSAVGRPAKLLDWVSPRSPRTNQPQFRPKIILDLLRASNLATRVAIRTVTSDSGEQPEDIGQRDWLTLHSATKRALDCMDRLPGVDSVALAKESLARWDSGSGES